MRSLRKVIAHWLLPEVLANNTAWVHRADLWAKATSQTLQQRLAQQDGIIATLQLAQHLRLDWAKELTKTVDVLGTPSYAERTEKAKKKPRFKLMKAT